MAVPERLIIRYVPRITYVLYILPVSYLTRGSERFVIVFGLNLSRRSDDNAPLQPFNGRLRQNRAYNVPECPRTIASIISANNTVMRALDTLAQHTVLIPRRRVHSFHPAFSSPFRPVLQPIHVADLASPSPRDHNGILPTWDARQNDPGPGSDAAGTGERAASVESVLSLSLSSRPVYTMTSNHDCSRSHSHGTVMVYIHLAVAIMTV